MVTRTERRREETHQNLLNAMRESIIEHGLCGATVAAVCDRADVAVGTFYNHFDGRDDAIAELAEVFADEVDSITAELLQEHADITIAVKLLASGFLARLEAEPSWAFFMAEVGGSTAWPRYRLSQTLVTVVEEGRARGQLDPSGDSYHRGYFMGAHLRAAVHLRSIDPQTPIDTEMFVKTFAIATGVPGIC